MLKNYGHKRLRPLLINLTMKTKKQIKQNKKELFLNFKKNSQKVIFSDLIGVERKKFIEYINQE